MACKIFKSEDPNAAVGGGIRQLDFISQLEGVPHVLENIFQYLDVATILEAEKISTTWQRLLTNPNVWKCVWKRNMRIPSTWKALSGRMEHFQPKLWDRMKKCDSSSYQEACRYVQGNIRQISQSGMKNLNFQALTTENYHMARDIRMNEKYVFICQENQVTIINRWTRELVKEFVCRGPVIDMQLDERFLVVQLETIPCHQIDVYDVQKLVHIQMLETKTLKLDFGLGSDVVFIYERYMQLEHLIFEVHRWNPTAARFVRDTETEHRLNLVDFRFTPSNLYVDEKYLIFDFTNIWPGKRLIQVFSLETMQLVRERQFEYNISKLNFIRTEYHDGGIVVQTCTADGKLGVALWDVDKDTVQPMAGHSRYQFSCAMAHHPFQIAMKEMKEKKNEFYQVKSIKLLLVQRGQLTRNSIIAKPSQSFVHIPFNCRDSFMFDGLQIIAKTYSSSESRYEIVMADLVCF